MAQFDSGSVDKLVAGEIASLNSKLTNMFLTPTVSRNNENAYSSGSVNTETFTFTDAQWPNGYFYGGILQAGSGGGWLSICQFTKGTGKTINLLCKEVAGTSHSINSTGMLVTVLLIKE